MRWLLRALTLVAFVSCGPVSNVASDGGTEAGQPVCDGKKDCPACSKCASQQLCATRIAACQQNSACQGLDQCINLCVNDVSCKQQCYSSNSQGVSTYEALMTCLMCEQCPSDCAGYRKCS
jgi:hypothetical protein